MKRSLEYRTHRAKIIHEWKPWTNSCGPKSPEGRATVSRNAEKGNPRGSIIAARALVRILEEDARVLAEANQTPIGA